MFRLASTASCGSQLWWRFLLKCSDWEELLLDPDESLLCEESFLSCLLWPGFISMFDSRFPYALFGRSDMVEWGEFLESPFSSSQGVVNSTCAPKCALTHSYTDNGLLLQPAPKWITGCGTPFCSKKVMGWRSPSLNPGQRNSTSGWSKSKTATSGVRQQGVSHGEVPSSKIVICWCKIVITSRNLSAELLIATFLGRFK